VDLVRADVSEETRASILRLIISSHRASVARYG
jgi:hypothetical protein